jgi:hypothetical protein
VTVDQFAAFLNDSGRQAATDPIRELGTLHTVLTDHILQPAAETDPAEPTVAPPSGGQSSRPMLTLLVDEFVAVAHSNYLQTTHDVQAPPMEVMLSKDQFVGILSSNQFSTSPTSDPPLSTEELQYMASAFMETRTDDMATGVKWIEFLVWLMHADGFDAAAGFVRSRIRLQFLVVVNPPQPHQDGPVSRHDDSVHRTNTEDFNKTAKVKFRWYAHERSKQEALIVGVGTPVDEFLTAVAVDVDTNLDIDGVYIYSHLRGTRLSAGKHTIMVHFLPSDKNYSPPMLEKSIEVMVTKKIPSLQWNSRANYLPSLYVSEALSEQQLCCQAVDTSINQLPTVVSGKYFYSHGHGYSFADAGEYLIEVTFVPNEMDTYEVVSTSRLLTVVIDPTARTAAAVQGNTNTSETSAVDVDDDLVEDGKLATRIEFASLTPTNSLVTSLHSVPYGEPLVQYIASSDPSQHQHISLNAVLMRYKAVDDATGAEVAGEFTFHPSLEMLLSVGKHVVTAKFTPSNDHDAIGKNEPQETIAQMTVYKSSTAAFDVTVVKATPTLVWTLMQSKNGILRLFTNEPISNILHNAAAMISVDAQTVAHGSVFYSHPLSYGFPKKGEYVISATFVPTESLSQNYCQVSMEKVVCVVDAPAIELIWEVSESSTIEYGTSLNQLGADTFRPRAIVSVDADDDALLDDNATSGESSGVQILDVEGEYVFSQTAEAVLPAGEHTLTVTFEPRIDGTYGYLGHCGPVSRSIKICVTPCPVDLDWTPVMASDETASSDDTTRVFVGTTVGSDLLCARAFARSVAKDTLIPIDGVYHYSKPLGSAFVTAGIKETIEVMFIPNDAVNYCIATKSLAVMVDDKHKPVLQWNRMYVNNVDCSMSITYGTSITKDMLSAHAIGDSFEEVDGVYEFSPALFGTSDSVVLNAGEHEITCTFTPTESNRYHSVTSCVHLTVRKATPALKVCTPLLEISVGEELTEAHMSCFCLDQQDIAGGMPVRGTFLYSRPVGYKFAKPGEFEHDAIFVLDTESEPNYVNFTRISTAITVKTVEKQSNSCILVWNSTTPVLDYGTPLSAKNVLTAKCYACALTNVLEEVAGKYVYFPDADTVLDAGKHTLFVKFVPEDTERFDMMYANMEVYVLKNKDKSAFSTVNLGLTMHERISAHVGEAIQSVFENTYANSVAGGTTGSTFYSLLYQDEKNASTSAASQITFPCAGAADILTVFIPDNTNSHEVCWQFTPVNVLPAMTPAPPAESRLLWAPAVKAIVFGQPLASTNFCNAVALVKTSTNTQGSGSSTRQTINTNNNKGIITYDPPVGTLLDAGEHTLTARFTPNDPIAVSACEQNIRITVHRQTPTLRWGSYIYDDSLYLEAGDELSDSLVHCTCSDEAVHGRFVYSKPPGYVFTVVGEHTLEVTFVPKDLKNYEVVSMTRTIVVRPLPRIELVVSLEGASTLPCTENGIVLEYGSKLEASMFTVSVSPVLGSQVVSTAAVISGQYVFTPALDTLLAVGDHEVSVLFIPDNQERYSDTASNHVALTVTKYRPVITWSPMDVFLVGNTNQKLTDRTLNATLNQMKMLPECLRDLSGTFVYDPPLNHVFDDDGPHPITVRFIPDAKFLDTVDDLSCCNITVYTLKNPKPKVLVTVAYNDHDIDVIDVENSNISHLNNDTFLRAMSPMNRPITPSAGPASPDILLDDSFDNSASRSTNMFGNTSERPEDESATVEALADIDSTMRPSLKPGIVQPNINVNFEDDAVNKPSNRIFGGETDTVEVRSILPVIINKQRKQADDESRIPQSPWREREEPQNNAATHERRPSSTVQVSLDQPIHVEIPRPRSELQPVRATAPSKQHQHGEEGQFTPGRPSTTAARAASPQRTDIINSVIVSPRQVTVVEPQPAISPIGPTSSPMRPQSARMSLAASNRESVAVPAMPAWPAMPTMPAAGASKGAAASRKQQRSTINTSNAPYQFRPNDYSPMAKAGVLEDDDDYDYQSSGMKAEADKVMIRVESVQLSSILLSSNDCEHCEVKLKYNNVEYHPEHVQHRSSEPGDSIMKGFVFHDCAFVALEQGIRGDHITLSVRGSTHLPDNKHIEFYCKVAVNISQVRLVNSKESVCLTVQSVPKLTPMDRSLPGIDNLAILNSCTFTIKVFLSVAIDESTAPLQAQQQIRQPAAAAPLKRRATRATSTKNPSYQHPQRKLTMFDKVPDKNSNNNSDFMF